MDQFNRTGRCQRFFAGATTGFCRRETEDGSQALTPRKDWMPHRTVDGGRADARLWQEPAQRCVNEALLLPEVGLEIGH